MKRHRSSVGFHWSLFLLIFLLMVYCSSLISDNCFGEEKLWTKQLGTSNSEDAYGVAVDTGDNIYVTGQTYGGLDGNTNAGSEDVFLVKYDSSGNKIWTRQLGTESYDQGLGLATDGSGNIYITGGTGGGLDGNNNVGGSDIFLIKYTADGNKIWTKQAGSTNSDSGYGVAVDGSGNIYITGGTNGGLDGNTNAGSYDIFLIKYNSNGVKQWTKQWGTSSYEHGSGVVVDTGGNIYVTGYTWGGLDGNTNFGYSISTSDTFLTKYDSNGTKQWTKQWGTDHGDYGAGLAVDTGGNIYIAGYIQLFQPAFYDRSIVPIDTDLFLVKYDSSGINQWAKYPRKSTSDECGTGVAVDTGGNIYLIGNTDGSLDGNTNAGSEDVFLVKYDSSGNKIWTKQFGTASDDRGRGVANDSYGNIYITGCTAGGLDGNTNAGSYDIFLTKYVPSSGTILGKVTKSDGITVIPQTLVETLQSGVVKSITTTDTNGNYSITAAIGTYDVHALASGYATKQVTGIVVIENSTTTVNFILLSTTPALLVNLTSLNFDKIVKGQSTTLTFTITNTECGTLIGNIAANKPWISASPASFSLSTGTSQNISVTVSPTRDLPDNVTYTGAVSITSNGGQGTVSISVIPTCAITYPEPISLSSGKVLTFWGTGVSYGTIRIYTLTGELVKELRETNGADKITWDLTNEQGEKVVRGIYFYTASNPKEPKGNRGKITVTK